MTAMQPAVFEKNKLEKRRKEKSQEKSPLKCEIGHLSFARIRPFQKALDGSTPTSDIRGN